MPGKTWTCWYGRNYIKLVVAQSERTKASFILLGCSPSLFTVHRVWDCASPLFKSRDPSSSTSWLGMQTYSPPNMWTTSTFTEHWPLPLPSLILPIIAVTMATPWYNWAFEFNVTITSMAGIVQHSVYTLTTAQGTMHVELMGKGSVWMDGEIQVKTVSCVSAY